MSKKKSPKPPKHVPWTQQPPATIYAADASGDIAIICELLDHIATLEGKAAEVERLSAMVYDTAPGEFSPDGWTWKQAFTSEKARRVEAEAAIENLHEKYAQERIFRSRQTLSDNTKMENQ